MNSDATTQTSSAATAAPSASEFTASPLRNRLRLELDAPVSEVWELLSAISPGFPSTASGSTGSRPSWTTPADASSTPATSSLSR